MVNATRYHCGQVFPELLINLPAGSPIEIYVRGARGNRRGTRGDMKKGNRRGGRWWMKSGTSEGAEEGGRKKSTWVDDKWRCEHKEQDWVWRVMMERKGEEERSGRMKGNRRRRGEGWKGTGEDEGRDEAGGKDKEKTGIDKEWWTEDGGGGMQ
jgi:hypothetical protein